MNCPACGQETTVQHSYHFGITSPCTNFYEPVRGRAAPNEYRCSICEGPIDEAEYKRQAEPERDRLQRQCAWMERRMELATCPPPYPIHCDDQSCAECKAAYLATKPWEQSEGKPTPMTATRCWELYRGARAQRDAALDSVDYLGGHLSTALVELAEARILLNQRLESIVAEEPGRILCPHYGATYGLTETVQRLQKELAEARAELLRIGRRVCDNGCGYAGCIGYHHHSNDPVEHCSACDQPMIAGHCQPEEAPDG